MRVTKDSVIGEVLDAEPETAGLFMDIGMYCLSCPMARSESIADACLAHGADPDELVSRINEFLTARESGR